MRIHFTTITLVIACLFLSSRSFSQISQQVNDELSSIHGNFQFDGQYYRPDSAIGAPYVPEKMLSNAFGQVSYTRGKFSAGGRYESYNNVMQGFDKRYKGQGIVNRYMRYKTNLLDITVGNFYEQFGSGLTLRAYEERGLLYDNSIDGIRIISNPIKGITIKGLTGKQRSFFTIGPGIVRGFDGEVNINDLFDSVLGNKKTKVILGGSFVGKYQQDQDPVYNLPENVGVFAGRMNLTRGGFNLYTEYASKNNDPSFQNNLSYHDGEAFFLSTSYATKGFAILLQGKRIDNMSFRSDRDASLQNLMINYLPATTKQHTYLMPAYYPYATQPNGEIGGMGEIQFKVPRNSILGGHYGMDVTINFSVAHGLKEHYLHDTAYGRNFYSAEWGAVGEQYYHDFFIEINKKFTKKWKMTALYSNQFYNKNMVQFGSDNAGYNNINSNIGVLDITYKYKSSSAIRLELQGLFTKSDPLHPTIANGSWGVGMLEWTPNSHWFVAVLDQYNYGNSNPAMQLHYFLGSVGYTKDAHRISISYGKQRAGIFCVGGVCRNVPASNGLSVSITTSF
ncbi:MAG: hypothetical protein JST26_04340 [Bacteroidetes bacterium]|nr:hypothetical protein [Bacteroidota bacterium]